jgi:hypothetical protein
MPYFMFLTCQGSEAARIYFYPFGNPAVNEKGSKIETWMELDINKKNNCMVSYEIKAR